MVIQEQRLFLLSIIPHLVRKASLFNSFCVWPSQFVSYLYIGVNTKMNENYNGCKSCYKHLCCWFRLKTRITSMLKTNRFQCFTSILFHPDIVHLYLFFQQMLFTINIPIEPSRRVTSALLAHMLRVQTTSWLSLLCQMDVLKPSGTYIIVNGCFSFLLLIYDGQRIIIRSACVIISVCTTPPRIWP